MKLKKVLAKLCTSLAPLAALVLIAAPVAANDYPTAARADYVFGCMASNGQTQEMLNRCSCSIDVIASLLPYDRYVAAETVVRMRQVGGEKTVMFRDTAIAKETLADLRRAQAEAEIRCF